MASIHCQYYSFALKHNVDINVIIPTPEGNEQITSDETKKMYPYKDGLPVVYLLHGAYGNYSSWLRFSNIERYAQKSCCVIVMANADNSFYQDMYSGSAFYTYFTEELPVFITSLFPVSKKREKTYVAGLSMGGYGAWYLALSKPELYSKAASMSGALDIVKLYEMAQTGKIEAPFLWNQLFEKPNELEGSTADLFKLIDDCQKKKLVPELYQACGTNDFLYDMNHSVLERLNKKGVSVIYEDGPGEHDWDFWDKYIQNILVWLLKS